MAWFTSEGSDKKTRRWLSPFLFAGFGPSPALPKSDDSIVECEFKIFIVGFGEGAAKRRVGRGATTSPTSSLLPHTPPCNNTADHRTWRVSWPVGRLAESILLTMSLFVPSIVAFHSRHSTTSTSILAPHLCSFFSI